jgi:hypothetical protein
MVETKRDWRSTNLVLIGKVVSGEGWGVKRYNLRWVCAGTIEWVRGLLGNLELVE